MPRTPSIVAALVGIALVLALLLVDEDRPPSSAPVEPGPAPAVPSAAPLGGLPRTTEPGAGRSPSGQDTEVRSPEPADGATFVGLARAPGGQPLPGVALEFEVSAPGEAQGRAGDRRRQVVSDEAGRFELSAPERLQVLAVELAGHVLVAAPQPRRDTEGRWEPHEVVLAPAATLELDVFDGEGRGLADVKVSVAISSAEPFGGRRRPADGTLRRTISGVTDGAGRLRLDGVWADQKLVVRTTAGEVHREHSRADGDVLLSAPATAGAPIVLRAGATRRFVFTLAHRFALFGRVLKEDGTPLGGAAVSLVTEEGLAGSPLRRSSSAATDAEGRYRIVRRDVEPLRRLRVTVSQAGKPSGWLSTRREPGYLHTVHRFELPAVPPPELELDLFVRSSLTIAGHVVDASGAPVPGGRVRLHRGVPGGGEPVGWGQIGSDGTFQVLGLEAGVYDLQVTPSEPYGEVWQRGLVAGVVGLKVVAPAERAARVRITAVTDGAELRDVVLLQGRLFPTDPQLTATVLESPFVGASPEGWPANEHGLWYGASSRTDERGAVTYASWRAPGGEDVLELNPGLYWFGAKGIDVHGRRCFPIGTGLVYVGAGEHELRFELTPAAELRGRVVGGSDVGLALALVTSAGDRLRLWPGSGPRRDVLPLGATGDFRLGEVPFGAFELWVGVEDELRGGRPRLRHPIVLGPEGPATVELRLRR